STVLPAETNQSHGKRSAAPDAGQLCRTCPKIYRRRQGERVVPKSVHQFPGHERRFRGVSSACWRAEEKDRRETRGSHHMPRLNETGKPGYIGGHGVPTRGVPLSAVLPQQNNYRGRKEGHVW